MQYLGEFFAFLTALGWAFSSILFEAASKKSDSVTVNVIRLIFGIVMLGTTTFITRGVFFPTDSTIHNWTFLSISGIIGLFLGDIFLYESYVLIGARISMLFMTMTPLIVGLFGFIFLGEKLLPLQMLAMFITCTGVLLVVVKPKTSTSDSKKLSPKGIAFITTAVILEALGNIFTKIGARNYDPSSSTQIRMICALGVFIFYLTFKKRWKRIFTSFLDKKLLLLIAFGTITATAGITFLIAAFNLINTGVASTFSSISPIIVIPISIIVFKEKVTLREIVGAFISVIGIALFFL